MFYLQQISKELFKEKTRILLTVFAIAWGTFAITTMLAIGEGLRVTFATTMAHSGKNLLKIQGGRTTKPYRGMHANIKINLNTNDFKAIKPLQNIAMISPVYSLSVKLSHKIGDTYYRPVLAVNDDYAEIHQIKVLPGGRFISPFDLAQQRSVIVLGTKTVEDVFKNDRDIVGKYINLGNKPFLIIGLMQPKSQLIGHRQADALQNWIPVTTYIAMQNPQILDSIDLTYKDPVQLGQLEQQIQRAVAANHGAAPDDDNVLHFREYAKRQEKINTFFLGMQIFLGIVGALTLMVAGVGIANVMYASINRATHEIGVRMAIGARTYQILMHYIAEALATSVIGGVLGLGMSGLLVLAMNKVPMQGRLFETIGRPHPILSMSVVVTVVLVLGFIGFLAGLFPALKASKVDPAEALSYE